MAVKLSRESGQYSLLLSEVAWLDVSALAPALTAALRVTKSDAVRMLRQQKGILAEGVSETAAAAAITTLKENRIEARAVLDSEVPALSKALEVSLIRVGERDFETPSVVGAGLPQLWPWENLLLACGGIILDASAQVEKLSNTLEKALGEDADVRKAHAQRQLERARHRAFPLAAEVRKPEPELGDALAVAARAKVGKKDKAVSDGEFDNVQTVLDLVFKQPLERLRITAKTRVQELPRSVHPAKQLHIIAAAIQPHVGKRGCAALEQLATAADAGTYLFEDLIQFDDYCRWCFMRQSS